MKTFLWVAGIGIIIIVALYLNHKGIFKKKEQAMQTKNIYNGVLSPQIFLDILNEDSNYIAGVFHGVNLKRTKDGELTKFEPDDKSAVTEQWIYMYDHIPATIFYVFQNKDNADHFFEIIKSYKGSIFNSFDSSYKVNSCVFVNRGYRINNNGYTIEIFDGEIKTHNEKQQAHKDSSFFSTSHLNEKSIQVSSEIVPDKGGKFHLNEEIDSQELVPDKGGKIHLDEEANKLDESTYIEEESGGLKFQVNLRSACLNKFIHNLYKKNTDNHFDIYVESNMFHFSGRLEADDVFGVISGLRNDTLFAKANKFNLKFLFTNNCKNLVCFYEQHHRYSFETNYPLNTVILTKEH